MRDALHRAAQIGVGGFAVAAAVALLAAPAGAHVTVTPSVTSAGSFTVLTLSIPHGCDGSPTTAVAIKIADGINAVTPTVNPGWTVEKVVAELKPPIRDSHGNEITKRVDQVIYTARTPLAADIRDVFQLSLQLPDKPGETLVFPIVQSCEQGEIAWAQIAAEGADEPEYPAPAFTLTEARVDDHGAAADQAPPLAEAGGTTGGGSNAVGWLALILGVLGFVAGGLALVRTRRDA